MEIINKTTKQQIKDFLQKSKIQKINNITLKYNNESPFDYYIIDLGEILRTKTIDIMCKYKNKLLYELYADIQGDKITILKVFDREKQKTYKNDRFLKKYIQIALIGHILKDYNIWE